MPPDPPTLACLCMYTHLATGLKYHCMYGIFCEHNTVGSNLSKRAGTKGCLDNRNI